MLNLGYKHELFKDVVQSALIEHLQGIAREVQRLNLEKGGIRVHHFHEVSQQPFRREVVERKVERLQHHGLCEEFLKKRVFQVLIDQGQMLDR